MHLTPCHVTAEWRSAAVCVPGDAPVAAGPPPVRGTGHAVAWLTVAAVAGALVAFLLARSRWRGCASCACCQVWGALRRQLLSPGTRASAHYRPVRAEDPDDTETALLLDAPLEEQRSPRPAARRRPAGHSPPPPDMTDICLDPACDSDDELLVV
ncbi:hypothetical protein FJT64_017251 [Amphibalanus amphitrite]|uniref:Uncharacterized protein n=1 Tax=Amphibalanus amphitrite TaxID=1232801 RepID=A0A6A4XA12_AMPAM|nr:hypothetical protein FJT64_017251 [Amphibalanus amphitrite]